MQSPSGERSQEGAETADSSSPTTNTKGVSWERLMESLVRITFAGSGGSLVGLALQKQQSASTSMPRPVVLVNKNKHLPMTWAISCMFFAWVIETSRLVSPTSSALTYLSTASPNSWIQNDYGRIAVTAVGDSMAGGTVAGLAGVIGMNQYRRRLVVGTVRPPPVMVAWGLGVGALLGALFGTIQAGIDAGNFYLQEQQSLEQGDAEASREKNETGDSR
ncbi:hypothetical protein FisN_6Hh281 [Fistulifera solaris]|jgi:hypothetical protein|uniref:Uncharacterized protein n=1 Tax=Fistulifera solaris TaxID=1519565 RepID=A0A1Z5K714_FISSO|nr:hypothetical protein FisN_6Hh281 [Fistulifera solaris]|eukprot:GAX22034.1 hypothetical protein FisN_6Hh281 [Fistulifera solaris]